MLLVLLLLGLAAVGVVRSAANSTPTPAEQAAQVAAGLRCPTCQGLSVADSDSPLAGRMRDIIDTQLAHGADPDEVREFFVGRYGEWVLLEPPVHDLGVLLWAAPVLVVTGGLFAASRVLARRRLPLAVRWAGVGLAGAAALAVLLAANTGARSAGELPTGNLPAAATDPVDTAAGPMPEIPGSEQRVAALAAVVAERPDDVAARLALAAAGFAVGRPDVVREQSDAVLERDPDHVDALLLRGLAATGPGDPEATAALHRFLALAPPDHPGAPLARAATAGAP